MYAFIYVYIWMYTRRICCNFRAFQRLGGGSRRGIGVRGRLCPLRGTGRAARVGGGRAGLPPGRGRGLGHPRAEEGRAGPDRVSWTGIPRPGGAVGAARVGAAAGCDPGPLTIRGARRHPGDRACSARGTLGALFVFAFASCRVLPFLPSRPVHRPRQSRGVPPDTSRATGLRRIPPAAHPRHALAGASPRCPGGCCPRTWQSPVGAQGDSDGAAWAGETGPRGHLDTALNSGEGLSGLLEERSRQSGPCCFSVRCPPLFQRLPSGGGRQGGKGAQTGDQGSGPLGASARSPPPPPEAGGLGVAALTVSDVGVEGFSPKEPRGKKCLSGA